MLCKGVMLYMMLITVFGNKLNKRRFFLSWVGVSLHLLFFYFSMGMCTCICTFIGPGVPIVAISAITAHDQYGIDY